LYEESVVAKQLTSAIAVRDFSQLTALDEETVHHLNKEEKPPDSREADPWRFELLDLRGGVMRKQTRKEELTTVKERK
jgi:hypothetical protein